MNLRHILLPLAMILELVLFFYCLLSRQNRVLAGYLCAALSFLLFIATAWLLLFPKVIPLETTGIYSVMEEDGFFIDKSRQESFSKEGNFREIPYTFWYPKDYPEKKGCPLVLFSHGAFGIKKSNESLCRELASQGYVVCSLDHPYHSFSTTLSDGKKVRVSFSFMKEIFSSNPQKATAESLPLFKKWMTLRTGDVNALLDHILEKVTENSKELTSYTLIDGSKLCVMGHSLGGSTALALGRQRRDLSAVISLEAPFLFDIQGIDEKGQYFFDSRAYPYPLLHVYSDATWDKLKNLKQYHQNVLYLNPSSEQIYNVHLSGIGHFGLTDLSLSSPFLVTLLDGASSQKSPREALQEINGICLSFLEKYLKPKKQ